MIVPMAEIHTCVAALIERHAVTPEQRALLEAALADLGRTLTSEGGSTPLCVELPLLVHAAITGDDAPAVPVAVAALLLYAAVELLDDLMDGDLAPAWSGYRTGEVMLAGSTLIATLPSLALVDLGIEGGMAATLQRTLARGLLAMSAGQQGDLALTGSDDAPVEKVDAVAQGKSGAFPAMLAAMAARLADAPEEVIEQYGAMGRAIGTARQFRSDCHDLFGPRDSRDLMHGTRGLPIALHLQALAGAERADFLALLDTARRDAGAREAVRQRLLNAGVPLECAFLIDLYCAQARTALTACVPRPPAAARLHALVDEASFLAPEPAL
jgi:geranylgeranyl pyrophosphate synthase